MTCYRVRDWPAHFENDRSRERDALSWCAVPNKQHGLGYARLLAMPDGPALYGAFVAMLLLLSRQKRPRQGWLTHDGTETGKPYSPEDIALVTRFPTGTVEAMLAACSGDSVGWIEANNGTPPRPIPAALPPDSRPTPARVTTHGNGMEGKGREDNTPPLPPVEPGGGIVEAEKSPPEPTKPADPPPKSPRPDGPAAVHDREVPEFLRTAEFASDTIAALFNDWLDERRQRRKYATARSCREALKKLSAYPPAVQEAALRDSIANSWQGIFPDRTRPGGGAGPPKPIQHLAPTEEHRRALAEHMAKPQRF